jgi:hypothetical protein
MHAGRLPLNAQSGKQNLLYNINSALMPQRHRDTEEITEFSNPLNLKKVVYEKHVKHEQKQ